MLKFELVLSFTLVVHSLCDFTADQCLKSHNELRQGHKDTPDLTYSDRLEKIAKGYADRLSRHDDSKDIRPTRVQPKRKRRDASIDPDMHLELWDGEIYYPQAKWDRNEDRSVKIGESIHKFCCYSRPHCPSRFFHDLKFPPSAEGVVKDWYNQEIGNYDFATGAPKTSTSQIVHFTNIAWKSTTQIGCAQTQVNSRGCVYTVVIYEQEGSTGNKDDFMKNITHLVNNNNLLVIIFLVVSLVVVIVISIVLCYCCRDNIRWKYMQLKIKTDTMKAEQELETDSTKLWWLRTFRRRPIQHRRPTMVRAKSINQKERPTIEIIPNSAPHRTRSSLPRVPNNADPGVRTAIRYKGISKKAPAGMPIDVFRNKQVQESSSTIQNNLRPALGRYPSSSGKPPPPLPVSQPSKPKRPVVPTALPPTAKNEPLKVMIPKPKASPKPIPAPRNSNEQAQPPSVRALKNVLENKNKESPPTTKKPAILPPRLRPPR